MHQDWELIRHVSRLYVSFTNTQIERFYLNFKNWYVINHSMYFEIFSEYIQTNMVTQICGLSIFIYVWSLFNY